MQIRQGIFKRPAMQIWPFSVQHSETFAFLLVTVAKLSTFKQLQCCHLKSSLFVLIMEWL